MAEEQAGRKDQLHSMFWWTKLFDAFKVALDPKKLLLAAVGIVAMAVGWWLLAVIFYETRKAPSKEDFRKEKYQAEEKMADKAAEELAANDFEKAKANYTFLRDKAGPNGELR